MAETSVNFASKEPLVNKARKQPKGLVVAIFFFATLSLVLIITLAIEVSNRGRSSVDKANCYLQGVDPQRPITGILRFSRTSEGIKVNGTVRGLTPFRSHGVHVHKYSPGEGGNLDNIGPIFNPGNKPHGCLDTNERHVGDMGNVAADDKGTGGIDYFNTLIQLGGEWSIIGRSLIIKSQQDNCLANSADGGAGAPLGFCVIEIAG